MLQATMTFDPFREAASQDGWVVYLGELNSAPTTTTYYETITAAQTAILTAFQADTEVNTYFADIAEETVLTSEAAAVAAELLALRTAEGL